MTGKRIALMELWLSICGQVCGLPWS